MCLWLVQEARTGCRNFCGQCCRCVFPLLCVFIVPVGALVGLLTGLTFALLKFLPGSVVAVKTFCARYCAVISAGQAEYDAEAARQPTQPPVTILDAAEARLASSGSKCAAELYCCCAPCALVIALLQPVWVLLALLCVALCQGPCMGISAGCASKSCADFKDKIYNVVRDLDMATSARAFGTRNTICRYTPISDVPPPGYPPPQYNAPPVAVAQPVQPTVPVAYAVS